MPIELFDNDQIEVIVFDDVTSDERVIEFRRVGSGGPEDSFAAVVVAGAGGWRDALVSINPRVDDVPVRLMIWLIDTARKKLRIPDSE